MREYFLNFFVWWYLVKTKNYFQHKVVNKLISLLNTTNTLPIVKNFSTPLFRDTSSFGKSISFFIKFWWVGLGSLKSIVLVIPNIFILIIMLILPAFPIVQIILFILGRR